MVKISFLGDISLNDDYNTLFHNNINPFSKITANLKDSDFVIGNLECLSKGNEGENLLKSPRLKTNPETLNFLNTLNVNLVTLAHNHIYDNLFDGYLKTTSFLNKKKIGYIGAGLTKELAEKPYVKKINNINFCFFNYVTKDTNPKLPEYSKVFLNLFDISKALDDINKYRKTADYIITILHWGGRLEGGIFPDITQFPIAKHLIDSGADLIIGHHSHTLQPYEIYKGKHIFYSLGNFCFSDIYFEDRILKINQKKKLEGIILNTIFTDNNYSIDLVPIKNNNLIIEQENKILTTIKRRQLIYKFIKKSKSLWLLYYFNYKYIEPVFRFLFSRDKTVSDKIRYFNLKNLLRYIKK